MRNSDQNLAYALQAMQQPELRETDEFLRWLDVPENKALFLDLMAGKEAAMRERLHRQRRATREKRIWMMLSGVAAVWALVFGLSSFFSSTPVAPEQPAIRFFAATEHASHVVLQVDDQPETLLEDSVMDVKDWKDLTPETPCCQTLTTPRGKSFQLILSDGTKVWINAESSLRYPVVFNGAERRVELKGEACFEVSKDEDCPFIVSADGMDTRVLGTKFNVRSYKTEDRHVTLIEGKVQVTNPHSRRSVVLQPGQDLTYGENEAEQISYVNLAAYTAWTEGLFYFEDAPLKEIMTSLGRWYNVDIDFEQVELYDIRLNFWADRNAQLEEALELLNGLEKVRLDYRDGTITIGHI